MEILLTQFTTQILARLNGPLHFRFVIQPLVAAGLAFRDGREDAQQQRTAYVWTLLTNPEQRQFLIHDGWKGIGKVFIIAFVLDLIYQVLAFHRIRLLGALISACVLALLPYILLRGLVNRMMKHSAQRARR